MPRVGETSELLKEEFEQKPQTLFEQKALLLEHLKKEFQALTDNQKELVLVRIFEQSIFDGFDFIEQLDCEAFGNDIFFHHDIQIKHPKLFQKLWSRMHEVQLGFFADGFILGDSQMVEKLTEKAKDDQKDFVTKECQALLDEIDAYYARVLSQRMESEIEQAERKQKNKKETERPSSKLLAPEKQGRRDGMDMGKSALERMYMMAEPHYYTKDFIDEIIWPELQAAILSGDRHYFYNFVTGGYDSKILIHKDKVSEEEFCQMVREKKVDEEIFFQLIFYYINEYGYRMKGAYPDTEILSESLQKKQSFLTKEQLRPFVSASKARAYSDARNLIPREYRGTMDELDIVESAWREKEAELEQKLKKIRYRGDIVDMRLKKLGEDALLKELRSLLKPNQTIEQDPQTGEYSIYEQEQTSSDKIENLEQESTPEDVRDFFDISKWKSFQFSLDGIRDISSLRENERGEIIGTTVDKQTGVKQGFYLSQFDSNHQPYSIEWNRGVIDRIPFPDGEGFINCIEVKGSPGLFSLEIYCKGKQVCPSMLCNKILPETLQKIYDKHYCCTILEGDPNQKNYCDLTIFIESDGVLNFRIDRVSSILYPSKETDSFLRLVDNTDRGISNSVSMKFSGSTQDVLAWGDVDPNSVCVNSKYCTCIFKSSSSGKFFLLNTLNPANRERYEKGDYGEAYSKIIPLRTQDKKIGLYVGFKENGLCLLRPDGSSSVQTKGDIDQKILNSFNEKNCAAIETPQGMGAVVEINGRYIFMDADGMTTHWYDYNKKNKEFVTESLCVGGQYVMPIEYSDSSSPGSSKMNFEIYEHGKNKILKTSDVMVIQGRAKVIFSIHEGVVTISCQNGDNFQMYRRSLSDLKQTQKRVNESENPPVEKRKIKYGEMDMQRGERLRLLNMLSKKYVDTDEFVKQYSLYYSYRNKESQTWLERKQAENPQFLSVIKRVMQKNPKEFLKLNTAEKDSASPAQIDWILKRLFPEQMKEQKIEKKTENHSSQASDFLRSGTITSLSGETDPRKLEKEGKELVRSRTELKEPLIKGVYGKWRDGHWEKISLPITPVITEPSEQRTFSISVDPNSQEYILPRSLNSKIISERVRGITGGIAFGLWKKEVPLQFVTEKDGSVRVKVSKKDIKEIVYSELASKLPPVPSDVSSKEYEEMKRRFILEQGSDLIEDIASSLPPEWIDFLGSIKELSPLEQIMEIQNFVRTIGYYDFDNREMEGKKEGKPFQEQLDAMKYRMDELKKKTNKKALNLKQIAGICGDFALINAALLRKAGFLSVVVEEFVPDGKGVKTSGSHAVVGFVWPGKNGEYHLFLSDPTPSGIDEKEQSWLSRIQQPSIEKQVETQKKEVKEFLATEVAAIEKTLQDLQKNPDAISELRNGVLEKSVNAVLQYGVKESHCNILEFVLRLARYGNIDIGQEILLRSAIEDEILLKREKEADDKSPAGTKMFLMFEEYLRRFVKSKVKDGVNHESAIQESLQTLTKIIDIASPHLEKMEQLSARAILTDLQAKHMKK